jgi:hypothetical protein
VCVKITAPCIASLQFPAGAMGRRAGVVKTPLEHFPVGGKDDVLQSILLALLIMEDKLKSNFVTKITITSVERGSTRKNNKTWHGNGTASIPWAPGFWQHSLGFWEGNSRAGGKQESISLG